MTIHLPVEPIGVEREVEALIRLWPAEAFDTEGESDPLATGGMQATFTVEDDQANDRARPPSIVLQHAVGLDNVQLVPGSGYLLELLLEGEQVAWLAFETHAE